MLSLCASLAKRPGAKSFTIFNFSNYVRSLEKNIVSGYRTSYPYAITLHKSQGQTMGKIVSDLGKKERLLGFIFVALLRVNNYKLILIIFKFKTEQVIPFI